LRHVFRKPELLQQPGSYSPGDYGTQYFDRIKSPQQSGSDDGHGKSHVYFTLGGPVSEDKFPEQDRISELLLGKVVRRIYRLRIFKKHEKLIFEVDQAFAYVVSFVVFEFRVLA
jgi:hypothetical protein